MTASGCKRVCKVTMREQNVSVRLGDCGGSNSIRFGKGNGVTYFGKVGPERHLKRESTSGPEEGNVNMHCHLVLKGNGIGCGASARLPPEGSQPLPNHFQTFLGHLRFVPKTSGLPLGGAAFC